MIEYDPERAKEELRRVEGMSSESAKRLAVAVISAATFIDIAESLRVIAREAELAMSGAFPTDVDDDAPSAEPVSFEVGDRVTAHGGDVIFEITDFGIDQDTPFAKLRNGEGGEFRVWVEDLAHADVALPDDDEGIITDDGAGGTVLIPSEAEAAAINADESEEEEVEADFPDPLDALKKHTKKGKKK